jgi:Zn-dependent metalloprotease
MFKKWLLIILTGLFIVIGGALYQQITKSLSGDDSESSNNGSNRSQSSDDQNESRSEKPKKPASELGSGEKVIGNTTIGQQGLPGNREVNISSRPQVANQEQAQEVVDDQARQAGLQSPSRLEVQGSSSDEYGNTYYQLKQTYHGIPVYGAKTILEVVDGHAEVLSGSWMEDIELEITPTYTAQQALLKAVEDLGASGELKAEITNDPQLVIYVSPQKASLAWAMETLILTSTDTEFVIVDASQPAFLLRVNVRMH